MKLPRSEWITLAEFSLSRIKHSAHDLTMKKDLDEFIGEVKKVMKNTLMEVST